jgi:hypothetical protein
MEMFDGVRVYWDGQRLHAKSLNNTLEVPREYFPSIPFEGVLW